MAAMPQVIYCADRSGEFTRPGTYGNDDPGPNQAEERQRGAPFRRPRPLLGSGCRSGHGAPPRYAASACEPPPALVQYDRREPGEKPHHRALLSDDYALRPSGPAQGRRPCCEGDRIRHVSWLDPLLPHTNRQAKSAPWTPQGTTVRFCKRQISAIISPSPSMVSRRPEHMEPPGRRTAAALSCYVRMRQVGWRRDRPHRVGPSGTGRHSPHAKPVAYRQYQKEQDDHAKNGLSDPDHVE